MVGLTNREQKYCKASNYTNELEITATSPRNDGHVINILCHDDNMRLELEDLYFNILKIDERYGNLVQNLAGKGDIFLELITNSDEGITNVLELSPQDVYRMETTKGRLICFQQAKNGPDYDLLIDPNKESEVIVYEPDQICHICLGTRNEMIKAKTYPYGVSVLSFEPNKIRRAVNDGLLEIGVRHLNIKKFSSTLFSIE